MRTASALFALLSATIVAACSSAGAPEESVGAEQATDRVVVEAAEKTRAALGIAAWGIADGSQSTVIHGYDAASAPIVSFEYRASHGAKSAFAATLSAGKGRASIRAESVSDARVDVLENSLGNNAAAQAVIARMVEDLRAERVRSTSNGSTTTLMLSTLRPLDEGLVGPGAELVDTCAVNLVPDAANAGATAQECSTNPGAPGCLFGVNGAAPPGGQARCCSPATGAANRYLNRNTDELKRSGELPMDPGISSSESCANFVTAVLQQSGMIGWHSNLVSDMHSRLLAEGWREVPASEARPGDVAVLGGSHTEIVDSNNGGAITLIGSNNANADGSQRITKQAPYDSGFVYLRAPNSC